MQVPSLAQEDPLEEEMAAHSVFLPGKFHGQRSLAGYSPWGRKESDMTEWPSTRCGPSTQCGPDTQVSGTGLSQERQQAEKSRDLDFRSGPADPLLFLWSRYISQICLSWDFPGGPVVKNLPCNAGDVGSIPGWGTKIPHASDQLSPLATAIEPGSHN